LGPKTPHCQSTKKKANQTIEQTQSKKDRQQKQSNLQLHYKISQTHILNNKIKLPWRAFQQQVKHIVHHPINERGFECVELQCQCAEEKGNRIFPAKASQRMNLGKPETAFASFCRI